MTNDYPVCPSCNDTECCGAGPDENDDHWVRMRQRLKNLRIALRLIADGPDTTTSRWLAGRAIAQDDMAAREKE